MSYIGIEIVVQIGNVLIELAPSGACNTSPYHLPQSENATLPNSLSILESREVRARI